MCVHAPWCFPVHHGSMQQKCGGQLSPTYMWQLKSCDHLRSFMGSCNHLRESSDFPDLLWSVLSNMAACLLEEILKDLGQQSHDLRIFNQVALSCQQCLLLTWCPAEACSGSSCLGASSLDCPSSLWSIGSNIHGPGLLLSNHWPAWNLWA